MPFPLAYYQMLIIESRALDHQAYTGLRRCISVNVDHSFGKSLWGFLRQVVPDATFEGPVLVFACKLARIGSGLRVWRPIGITLKGDSRHGDDRPCGEPLFEIVIFRLALHQPETPPIVVDNDTDVVRIFE